ARHGPDNPGAAREDVKSILNDISKAEPRFVSAALRAATRAAVDGLTTPARRALAHTDPAVTAAAIEYLDRFAPDDLRPLLGRYLASTEPRIKTAALRVLQRSDPLQAVSALEAMLQSRQPAQQKLGVACLIHVEFALVREALAALLATNPAPDILEAGLCLFQTNADPEGVYLLYTIERRLPPDAARAVERVRREMMSALAADGRLPADMHIAEAELAGRAGREATKQAAQPPAYAYRVLKKTIAASDDRAAGAFHLSDEARRTLTGFLPAVLVLVAAVILWNVLAGRDGGGSESPGPATASLAEGRHQIRQIEGWVRPGSSSRAEFLVEAETGERFWVPAGDYDPVPAPDAKFKGTLALVQKRDDGAWSARRAAAAGLR
ncbi:MAG TPA: HEAT repeat domain-containing protein, partial [Candidatus Ozemobacteraceae bacterium]